MAEEKKKTTRKKGSSNKVTLDKNELSEIITNALLEYDEQKAQKEEQEYYSEPKKEKCQLGMFFKMMFNTKKYVATKNSNVLVIKELIAIVYNLLGVLLYLFSGLLMLCAFSWLIPRLNQSLPFWAYIIYFIASFITFLIAKVVKIMALDVKRSKDNNFIISLFALIISIVSMIISIVALRSSL